MTKKYALFPGHVRSRNDGQEHYIGVEALARLYGVRLADCIVVPDAPAFSGAQRGRDLSKYVHLGPRYDGDYTLPGADQ